MVIHAGETIDGRYRIYELLGEGGMGRVWKAQDQALDRWVALKEVLPRRGEEGAFDLLMSEARLAARLDHPNIVKVHDIFRHQGAPVIVMAYVEGDSLRSGMNEHEGLTAYGLARVALDLLEALAHAHARRVVHRDLKPENILMDQPSVSLAGPEDGPEIHIDSASWQMMLAEARQMRRDRAVIADFGIARLRSVAPPGTDPTTTAFAGTLPYASPEQIRGRPATPAFDMWALGVILYELTERRRPFNGRDQFELAEQIQYAPAPPAVRAGAMAGLIQDLLEKDPGKRPSAHQARARVEAMLAGGVGGHPPTLEEPPDRSTTTLPPTRSRVTQPPPKPPTDEQRTLSARLLTSIHQGVCLVPAFTMLAIFIARLPLLRASYGGKEVVLGTAPGPGWAWPLFFFVVLSMAVGLVGLVHPGWGALGAVACLGLGLYAERYAADKVGLHDSSYVVELWPLKILGVLLAALLFLGTARAIGAGEPESRT
ncbi:serine/threonine-protein kinase [Streptomyces sp. NPDC059373]